jgi:transposase
MSRDLTDAQWAVLRPLLPPPARTGRPRADDRRVFNGICYVLRTGCRWADLPGQYGSPATCHRRLSQWMQDGTWLWVWEALLIMLNRQDKLRLDRTILDASLVPAKKGAPVSATAARLASSGRSARSWSMPGASRSP